LIKELTSDEPRARSARAKSGDKSPHSKIREDPPGVNARAYYRWRGNARERAWTVAAAVAASCNRNCKVPTTRNVA
jgi:hypothetical protein